ncbi:ABC transporter substrate-binding protein [Clostridium cylindrosporum]|uniref:Putative aliphatic sulfonates-binding protein SsuA n=1 Tax=Clostridium cylindrosporum DSM 605 TaxID=1121307 RepID=A0A0J8G028_CLOCY|nr:aliphatic sulfonate ABC transporter substrate-binding protein [Clostridium cylindrosporum]KMT21156.1 putative aliphatic sulfonates-binding protein SsuA [Clostridium cylindrosporum DSM 605]
MKKKLLKFITITTLLSVGLVGCGKEEKASPTNANTTTKKNLVVRIGHQPGHLQPILAEKFGYFKEEFEKDNIKIELKEFAAGPPIIEAFAAGELDLGLTGDQPALQGKANNIDLKAIASYGATESGNALIAAKGSKVEKIKDLKGKKVGVTIGSVAHQLILIQLESVGLKQSDIKLVNLSPGDIYTSIVSKNIDAAVTWEPNISKAVSSGAAKIIADGTGYKYNVNIIVGNNKFLKENPDITARILKVFNKTVDWADKNPDEAIDIIAKEAGLDKSAFDASFKKFSRDLPLDKKRIDSIEQTAKYLKKNNIIRTDINVNDFIDTSYLEAAGIK